MMNIGLFKNVWKHIKKSYMETKTFAAYLKYCCNHFILICCFTYIGPDY